MQRLSPVRLAWSVVLASSFGLGSSATADACMCGQGQCRTALTAATLFEATVLGLVPPPPATPLGATVVQLADVRMIRGQTPRQLVVDQSSCGYEFTVGVRYLIEADSSSAASPNPPGVVSASHCGLTRPAAKSSGVRTFMTSPLETRPRVWGTLTAETTSHRQDASRGGGPPIAGAVVALSGPVQRTVATSPGGEFVFPPVPDGAYRMTVELPASRADVSVPRYAEFTLGPETPCVAWDLVAMSTARVVGRIVDATGRPVPNVQVQLYTPGYNVFDRDFVQRPGGSDVSGTFEIERVPPGRFVVGIGVPRPEEGMPFAPAQASLANSTVITVGPGATVELPPIVARRAPFVTITGAVEAPRGSRLGRLAIVASAADAQEAGRWRLADTDERGRFTIGVLRGVRYRIEARDGDHIVARLDAVIGDAPLVLTVGK